MTDKRLVTTGGDYEARGSVAQAFFGGNFTNFFRFRAKKKIKNQNNKEKMSDRYLVRDPLVSIRNQPEALLKYVTKQRVGGNKVVFWLAI